MHFLPEKQFHGAVDWQPHNPVLAIDPTITVEKPLLRQVIFPEICAGVWLNARRGRHRPLRGERRSNERTGIPGLLKVFEQPDERERSGGQNGGH